MSKKKNATPVTWAQAFRDASVALINKGQAPVMALFAPSYRMHLRNELFRLRDDLRMLKIEGEVRREDERVFEFIHEGLNRFLNRLSQLSILDYILIAKELSSDREFQERVAERIEVLEACSNEKLKNIFSGSSHVVIRALIANSGAWFIYLLPLIIVFFCVRAINIYISKAISSSAKELLLAPSSVAKQFFHDNGSPHGSVA